MSPSGKYLRNSPCAMDDLVKRHGALVKRIAYHLMARLPPNVQVDDLIQAGMIGLVEAARNYDPRQGAAFETYAGIRARGAMLDEVRKTNWAPRALNRKMRQISQAIQEIETREGRDARDVEVAGRLDISLDEYHRTLRDATGRTIFGFDDLVAGDESISEGMTGGISGPLEELETSELKSTLAKVLSGMPERERQVTSLYYFEEMNLREIGEVLGVSESRVCQILGQSLIRLRSRMSEWRQSGADLGPESGTPAARRPIPKAAKR